eukprot:gene8991-10546_t
MCRHGYVGLLLDKLRRGCDVTYTQDSAESIVRSVRDYRVFQEIYSYAKEWFYTDTALDHAAWTGTVDIVKLLLAQTTPQLTPSHRTLTGAIGSGNYQMLKLIHDTYPETCEHSNRFEGQDLQLEALATKNEDFIRLFHKIYPEVVSRDTRGQALAFLALEDINMLVEYKTKFKFTRGLIREFMGSQHYTGSSSQMDYLLAVWRLYYPNEPLDLDDYRPIIGSGHLSHVTNKTSQWLVVTSDNQIEQVKLMAMSNPEYTSKMFAYACGNGAINIVRYLYDHVADDLTRYPYLGYALLFCQATVVEYLLSRRPRLVDHVWRMVGMSGNIALKELLWRYVDPARKIDAYTEMLGEIKSNGWSVLLLNHIYDSSSPRIRIDSIVDLDKLGPVSLTFIKNAFERGFIDKTTPKIRPLVSAAVKHGRVDILEYLCSISPRPVVITKESVIDAVVGGQVPMVRLIYRINQMLTPQYLLRRNEVKANSSMKAVLKEIDGLEKGKVTEKQLLKKRRRTK